MAELDGVSQAPRAIEGTAGGSEVRGGQRKSPQGGGCVEEGTASGRGQGGGTGHGEHAHRRRGGYLWGHRMEGQVG